MSILSKDFHTGIIEWSYVGEYYNYSGRNLDFPVSFWGAFSGASLGLLIGVLRYKLRIFEVMEAGTLGFLPWLGIYFLGDSIINSSLPSFLAFFAITCLVTLFAFLDSH